MKSLKSNDYQYPEITFSNKLKNISYSLNGVSSLYPNGATGDGVTQSVKYADFLGVIRPTENKGHITTAHKLMQLCGQVMKYAHLTGRIRYNPAAGLSAALQPLRHENLAAVTDPGDIGRLLRDLDAYEGFPSITAFLRILPYVFTRPSELRRAEWSEFNFTEALLAYSCKQNENAPTAHCPPIASGNRQT